ncbi:hypothetical protein BGZ76_003765 [Entomortierella beljakovae]|nr:hypothetical protein BGZ76_003765 [Entomortierella beljakovae]
MRASWGVLSGITFSSLQGSRGYFWSACGDRSLSWGSEDMLMEKEPVGFMVLHNAIRNRGLSIVAVGIVNLGTNTPPKGLDLIDSQS